MLNGSQVDHLGSQGSLTYDRSQSSLYAVNAGSNTVSVFSVRGDDLTLRQVVSSGGTFPVSVASHGNLVSVLNALNGGSVQEYYAFFGHLFPVPGSNRALGLTIPSDTNQFTHTPGQVSYSPDGSQLIVTTKASSNALDVFNVGFFGFLSRSPVVTSLPGTVPFAITFDQAGHLVIGEAGTSSLATFTLNRDGTATQIDSLARGQKGLVLGHRRRSVLLYRQYRRQLDQRVSDRPDRSADPPRVHTDRPGDSRRLGHSRWSVPLCADRR